MPPARDIFDQTHDKTIFFSRVNDERGYFRLTEGLVGLKPPLPADEIEGVAIGARLADHGNRTLQAKLANILDDALEHFAVAHAWIDHGDPVEGNLLDMRDNRLLVHLRSPTFVRAAISYS